MASTLPLLMQAADFLAQAGPLNGPAQNTLRLSRTASVKVLATDAAQLSSLGIQRN